MIVRHQKMRLMLPLRLLLGPARTQIPQSSAAIQNQLESIWSRQFHAWRVPAITPRRRIDGCRRSAHAPKTQFGDRIRHFTLDGSLRTGDATHAEARAP